MIHISRPWKLSNFQDPLPPCQSTSKSFPPPWPWMSNSKWTPPLQMITSQLKGNIIQGWLLYVIGSFFQVSFRFQYQLINLLWLSFDFFSFSWSLRICFFVALYSCVCSCPKISKCLLFIIIHIFSTHFAINLFCLHNLKTLTMEQQLHHACKRTKSKQNQKPSHVTFKLTTRYIVRFSPQTMKWYH